MAYLITSRRSCALAYKNPIPAETANGIGLNIKMDSFALMMMCFLLGSTYGNVFEDLIEDYVERKLENQEDPLPPTPNPNLRMCHGVGVDCEHCGDCYPGGWCIRNHGSKPKCLCNYGWTGPNAEYLPNTNDKAWGINRIRADNCLHACHYTHFVRNLTCIAPITPTTITIPTGKHPPHPRCHDLCGKYEGTCDTSNGWCTCCRGWAGPNKRYNAAKDRYEASYCNQECPYLGKGVRNDNCVKCDDRCEKSEGKCLPNGRCLCCLGWTGPKAKYGSGIHHKRIVADYCDVYCPYTLSRRDHRCIDPYYIGKRRFEGHKIDVTK